MGSNPALDSTDYPLQGNSDLNNVNSKTEKTTRTLEDNTFTKPTKLSPHIDQYTTPPLQTKSIFDDAFSPTNYGSNFTTTVNSTGDIIHSTSSFDEIQNLPTPVTFNHSNPTSAKTPTPRSTSVFPIDETSPTLPFIDTNSANSDKNNFPPISTGLKIPKIRNQNHPNLHTKKKNLEMKNILMDKNTLDPTTKNMNNIVAYNQRIFSEFKLRDRGGSSSEETSPIDFAKPRMASIDQSQSKNASSILLQNIKPVERVVSLPFPHLNLRQDFVKNNQQTFTNSEDIFQDKGNEKEINKNKDKNKDQDKDDSIHETSFERSIQMYSISEPTTKQCWYISKQIGEGSFSKVFLADDNKTAIKIINTRHNKDGEQTEDVRLRINNSLTRELEVLKILHHPNIIKLIGTDYNFTNPSDNNEISMAMEYCIGGDLYNFVLNNHSQLSSELIRCIFANIVSAIAYMHQLDIVHRDIKLENILLKFSALDILSNGVSKSKNHEPILVLSDFGLSKKIDPKNPMLSTRCGSEDYVSPELLLGMPYDGKENDCWSLGVVLYSILEDRLPFDPLPNEQSQNKLKRKAKPSHRIAMISWSWYLLKDEKLSLEFSDAKKIVKKLLAKRSKRANIEEIKNDPWCSPYIIKGDMNNE